jgi:hypothetical protein
MRFRQSAENGIQLCQFAVVIVGGEGGAGLDPIQDDYARIAAEANLELSRVRAFRAKRTPNEPVLEIAPAAENGASAADWRAELEATVQAVQELTKADRYERRAFSRRNRAFRKLKSAPIASTRGDRALATGRAAALHVATRITTLGAPLVLGRQNGFVS